MKYKLQCKFTWGWDGSGSFPGTFTKKKAEENIIEGEKKSQMGLKYRMVPVVPGSRATIAKGYQREIAKLQTQREKLYARALRTLKVKDDNSAFDYFFNDQQGLNSFTEGLE